jgi:cytoskeletal protein CcmA (bactofilin family)
MAYASVIAGSAVIRGNVRGDTSLEILGRVEGDVGVTGDLTVGPDAVVVGTVSGARVLIGGSVEGDVTGTEAVVIADTGRVVGDLVAPRIGVSEGAHVRGSVRTDGGSSGNGASASSRPAVSRVAPESRAAAAAPAPRPALAAAPAPTPVAAVAPPKPAPPLAKKAPPPPVIPAPRPGVRAKKKVARR